MDSSDPYGLGYRDVDGDRYTEVLVSNMDATAGWQATQRLRDWEREHLDLGESERLLDVGCGTGDAGIALASDLGANGELVGVDASEAMLRVARQRAGKAFCTVRFIRGEAGSLDHADSYFDVVRSERTLQWVLDPEAAVVEFARVLRSGGRLSLIDTDWSTLHVEAGNPRITEAIRESVRIEHSRPSNVGRRLARLTDAAGLSVAAESTERQDWASWDPDDAPTPAGCFSMRSLAEGLVETGHLGSADVEGFVEEIHEAARRQVFAMSLTMHAVIAIKR